MNVLIVLTSSDDELGDLGRRAGYWFEELAAPYYKFRDAGVSIDIASPKGGEPPLDRLSAEPAYQTDDTRRFDADADAKAKLAATLRLTEVDLTRYDAVFYPGGHGPLFDLVEEPHSISLIEQALADGKPVALVCHAPGALRDVKKPDGSPLVAGLRITGFSNSEEENVDPHLPGAIPFSLEDMLKAQGAHYTKAQDWAPYVVTDGLLITGQNPASAGPAAETLIRRLTTVGG